MRRVMSRETALPEHVVESRFRQNKPLPVNARKRSRYPDAGSPLFRQHLETLKRAGENRNTVDPEFLDYDRFNTDVMATPGEGRLTRIDDRRDDAKS